MLTAERFPVWLGRVPGLGPLLKGLAGLHRDGSVVTIRRGLAAGMRYKRYRRYHPQFWLGVWEIEVQKAICRELLPGDTFYDVGACAGFFSLVAANRVGRSGHVFAFECLPSNAQVIREQFRENGLVNCTMIEAAVSNQEGFAEFIETSNPGENQLVQIAFRTGRIVRVKTIRLDEFSETHPKPTLIKMDIEGAETIALEGAGRLLRSKDSPKLLIELHGAELAKAVRTILLECGYVLCDLEGRVVAGEALPHYVIGYPARIWSELSFREEGQCNRLR